MNNGNTLTINVDLGINFSLRVNISFSAEELQQSEKVNSLIRDCLRLELPLPGKLGSADSVPGLLDHLRIKVKETLHLLFGESRRQVKFTFSVNKPSVVLETTDLL